jgi:hypothetical protein
VHLTTLLLLLLLLPSCVCSGAPRFPHGVPHPRPGHQRQHADRRGVSRQQVQRGWDTSERLHQLYQRHGDCRGAASQPQQRQRLP